MKKIILLGYMGSGKSTTAEWLSHQMNLQWLDLDQVIEKKTGTSISNLFQTKGEIFFRKLEHETLRALITNDEGFVLSLGGGTPCYANNHEFLKSNDVVSFYLKTSIDELHARLLPEKQTRPLIAQMDDAQMKEFIAISLFERSYFYHHATHTIVTDGKSPETVALEIRKILV